MEDTNKLLSETRKTMQDMKEEFNKDIESLIKRNEALAIKSSLSQIKHSVEVSPTN
jgi:hypothetical protein